MIKSIRYIVLSSGIFCVCLLFAFLAVVADDNDGKIRFRSGWIVAAEQSTSSPKIINISKYEPPSRITADVAYVALVMRLDEGRKLSIYDYVLKRGPSEYHCIALRENDGDFDSSKWLIENTNPKKTYTMLFKIQTAPFGQSSDLDLKFNLISPAGEYLRIKINNLRAAKFTNPNKIPEDGIYAQRLIPKDELVPVKKPDVVTPEPAKDPVVNKDAAPNIPKK